jgi:O-antigen/teichoic acid export membrane protein
MRTGGGKTFLSAVFWNTFGMAVGFPLGIAMAVMVGRWLGPDGKGEYTLATLVGSLLFTLLNLGIPASISYFVGGRRAGEGSLVKSVVLLAVLLSAASMAAAWLLDRTGWCRYLFGVPRFSRAMWLVVLGLPSSFLGTFLQFVILGHGRRVLFGVLPTVGQLVNFILILALFLSGRLSPATAVAAMVATQVLMAAILLCYTQRLVHWLHAAVVPLQLLRELASYSAVTYVANTVQFLVQRLDVFLISVMLDTVAVGLYSVAYGFAELLLMVPQRLAALFLPRVAGEGSGTTMAGEVRLLTSVVFLGSAIVAALVAMLGPFAIRLLYGPRFAPSAVPLLLLLPGVCALSASSILAAFLAGRGQVTTNLRVTIAGLLLNAALNVVLIPRYGLAGAAGVSSLTYCFQTLLLARSAARITKDHVLALVLWPPPGQVLGLLRRALATS